MSEESRNLAEGLHIMQDFIRISKYAGMQNDLAQAGGIETLRTLFPKAVFVPYRKPGAALV